MMSSEIDPLNEIQSNVDRLFDSAFYLYTSGRYATSTHISILCIEECAKYLIIYCKSHLPEKVFRKRFQHIHKYAVSGAPWFLSGTFSIVYMLDIATQVLSDDKSIADELKGLSDYVSSVFFRNDPKTVADAIMGVLEPENKEFAERFSKSYDDREKDRLNSVYVDVSDDLKIKASPALIDKKKSKHYLQDAEYCCAVVKFISDPKKTIGEFVEMLPPAERRKMKADAMEKAKKLAADSPWTAAEAP